MLKYNLWITALFAWTALTAQNVGIGTTNPAASAQLEVSSTTKGFLMPRMTTAQRNSIVSPAIGLTIYNLDDNCTDSWNGSQWMKNCGATQTLDTLPAWVQKFSFPGSTRARASGFCIGNKGYLGLGQNGINLLKDFWEFDPVENTWTQKADFQGQGKQLAVGFSIGNKGYFGTGSTQSASVSKDFWEYDPATNQWTQKQDFGGLARSAAVGFSIGNKGYIGTGGGGGIFFKDFWEYDPATNQWTQKQDFGGLARQVAVGFSIGNKGYIGTGIGGVNFFKDFWEYNPAFDLWTQKQDFGGLPRSNATGFGIQGKGYIGAGYNGNFFNDFWEYDTTGNQWTQKPNFGGSARGGAAGFSIGRRGYIGSGNANGTLTNDFWEYNPLPIQASYSSSPAVVNALQYNDGSWTRNADTLFTSSLQNRVGIGTASPSAQLHVVGKTRTDAFQMPSGAIEGYVLRTDATGLASWISPTALSITAAGVAGGDLTGAYPNPVLTASGVTPGTYSKILVDAKGRVTAGAQLVAADITPLETDPQVGIITTNAVPKWNGTTLESSAIIEVSGNVGIGLSPVKRLDVLGSGGLRVSSTNPGTGTADWIAGNFGGTAGDRVVMGNISSVATIGAHNNALNTWVNLSINPGPGNVGIGTLTAVNKLDVEGGVAIGSGYAGTYAAPSNGAIIQGNVVIGNSVSETSATLEVYGTAKIGKVGTTLSGIVKRTYGLPAGSFGANSSLSYTFAFAGATTGGSVMVSPSSALPAGMVIAYGWVSATNSVDVVLRNTTGANIAYPGGINLHITVVTDQ